MTAGATPERLERRDSFSVAEIVETLEKQLATTTTTIEDRRDDSSCRSGEDVADGAGAKEISEDGGKDAGEEVQEEEDVESQTEETGNEGPDVDVEDRESLSGGPPKPLEIPESVKGDDAAQPLTPLESPILEYSSDDTDDHGAASTSPFSFSNNDDSLSTLHDSSLTKYHPHHHNLLHNQSRSNDGSGYLSSVDEHSILHHHGDHDKEALLLNRRNGEGRTALAVASSKNNLEGVTTLLTHGADASISDDRGRSPLHLAIECSSSGVGVSVDDNNDDRVRRRRCERCVRILLDHGADANVQDDLGQTPLHLAAQRGYAGCLSILLRYGSADRNAEDGSGNTALHYAAELEDSATMRALLSSGGDEEEIEEPDTVEQQQDGCTALHAKDEAAVAAGRNYDPMNGTTSNEEWWMSSRSRESPRVTAEGDESTRETEQPISHGSSANGMVDARHMAIWERFFENAAASSQHRQTFIDDDTNERDRQQRPSFVRDNGNARGFTMLHRACYASDLESCRMLLDHDYADVDIDAVDFHGNTALHVASSRNDRKIVRALLQNAARVDVANFDGNTPLQLCLLGDKPCPRCVSLLLEYGSDLVESDGACLEHVASRPDTESSLCPYPLRGESFPVFENLRTGGGRDRTKEKSRCADPTKQGDTRFCLSDRPEEGIASAGVLGFMTNVIMRYISLFLPKLRPVGITATDKCSAALPSPLPFASTFTMHSLEDGESSFARVEPPAHLARAMEEWKESHPNEIPDLSRLEPPDDLKIALAEAKKRK